jgi:hypothetical protein
MAIIHTYFLKYLSELFRDPNYPYDFLADPILALAELCSRKTNNNFLSHNSLSDNLIQEAVARYQAHGIIGVIYAYFKHRIINQFVDSSVERKIIVLKKGYKALPATKAAIILKGFGYELTEEKILAIYASYGLVRSLKDLVDRYDFVDINRRVEKLAWLVKESTGSDELQKVQRRYEAIHAYMVSAQGKKEEAIKKSALGRSLFFHYLKSFQRYGFLGLIDKGKGVFRNSKTGLENEARIVIDKIQNPIHQETFYVESLKYKKIKVDRSSIAKIFSRWNVSSFKSAFVSNLERLESLPEVQAETIDTNINKYVALYVDGNFLPFLRGIKRNGIYLNAPGLLVLWVYLEQLGIMPVLDKMGLTNEQNGYNWFDHLLFNIGRIFYGISSYSRACSHEDPSLCFFAHLVKLPCNDTFLNGLGAISQRQIFDLQKWLLARIKDLGLVVGRRVLFDFHQIDLDVELDKLRQFGKGPSPKKKICCNGFRPHIAWDLDTGNLIVAEFRKASARGPTTVKRFVKDFLLSLFQGLFEEVYIDSEYTGKDVWNFILDSNEGMGAQLICCIKQNAFVRKHRDTFILEHREDDAFWCHWDDNHVYSAKTFPLVWEYICPKDKKNKKFSLTCVVKKNRKTGKLRTFGSSKPNQSSQQILESYIHRWTIENGIKDLVHSFFLDKCPGTNPHQVNVHFLLVSICKHLYKMIQIDAGSLMKNSDGSAKSLETMRDYLFKQGCAKVMISKDTIEVHFLNSFSPKFTEHLEGFYHLIHNKMTNGLKILGGFKLQFFLRPPYGDENKNALKKVPLTPAKIFEVHGKSG